MRKIWAFLLLGMFSLCTTAAEAKVCFLPNVLIGGKCVSLSKAKYNDCKGFTETTPCEDVGKETIESCTNDNGTTYYKCGCRGDVISWDVINQHPGWVCETGYSQECGCSAEHISCTYEYKYLGDGTGKCAKSDENDNSRGVGACALPNGRVYYKDCNCNGYPYECDSMTGLKAPTGAGDTTVGCKSPHDTNYKYKECECANGWTNGSCESNANGCLMPISYVTANDGELTCALCDERLCRTNGESNLETVYCAPKKVNGVQTYGGEYLTRTITDCVDLGFVQGATGGFCPAGTQKAGEVGVKCPFDGRYMFCENKEGCYPTQDACELAESVKECKEVGGCYRVYECNEGYELNENLGICVVAECPEGFTTEALHCDDAEHGIMHGYNGSPYQQGTSGEADCEQCECDIELARSKGYCKYTNNASGNGGTLIGEGIASVPCCDGSYSECSFPFGTTTPSEGVKTHERHEACGKTYYVPKDCLEGYTMKNGDCKLVGCANEYSTGIQSAKDCTNGSKGTIGWKIKAQKVGDEVIQSGGKTCNKCTCDTAGLGCSWNVSNKGEFGRLDENTACCDGTYKSCVANLCSGSGSDDLTEDSDPTNDCIPNSATVALCSAKPAHVVNLKRYEACGQKPRCLVGQCEQGYRISDDGQSCLFNGTCDPAQGLILNAAGSDCECGNGWSANPENACTTQGLTYKDSDTCTKGGSFYTIRHNNDGSCHKADTVPNGTCDESQGWYSDSTDACDAFGPKKGSSSWNTDFKECFGDYCYDQICILENGGIYPIHVNSAHACVQVQDNLTDCNASQHWVKSGDKCVCNSSEGYRDDHQGGCEFHCDIILHSGGHDNCPEHALECVRQVADSYGNSCWYVKYGQCEEGYAYNLHNTYECDCDNNHGYKDDGNGNCVLSTCNYTYTSKPEHSSYTGGTCTDANGIERHEGWECNSGYGKKSVNGQLGCHPLLTVIFNNVGNYEYGCNQDLAGNWVPPTCIIEIQGNTEDTVTVSFNSPYRYPVEEDSNITLKLFCSTRKCLYRTYGQYAGTYAPGEWVWNAEVITKSLSMSAPQTVTIDIESTDFTL